ncbi:HD domain-containing protein [Streptomyces incarnatus]
MTHRPITCVDALLGLLAGCAGVWDTPDRSGDPVDLLDHGLQVAALLAVSRPDDEEAQAAGLVHDIGHHLVPGGEAGHGGHAATAVEGLLGPRVARLVALHIPAKRYLAATDPGLAVPGERSHPRLPGRPDEPGGDRRLRGRTGRRGGGRAAPRRRRREGRRPAGTAPGELAAGPGTRRRRPRPDRSRRMLMCSWWDGGGVPL